jgi:putative inorganic carbon (HCO3(-)) transporter
MRDFALIGAILAGLAMTFPYPFTGLLIWTWFSIQSPHEEAYGFARVQPLNLIIAVVTVFALLCSKERKAPPWRFLTVVMLAFLCWTTINSFFAVQPDWSWPFWDRTWKTFALGFFIAAMASNVVRIHATVWTIVFSLFYYGIKGGFFTVLHGGTYLVFGPPDTIIGDNNQLAVALLMTLPLANYLRRQSSNRFVALSLVAGMTLTLLAIVGSYSRGAFLGLLALAVAGLVRTRRRLAYLAFAAAVGFAILALMPQSFWDRMSTVSSADSDSSFQGREFAWQVAFRYAKDHFPFGAGFYGPQLGSVFQTYFPEQSPRAAHSIYFEVLGDQGFIGLSIYLLLLIGAFVKCSRIINQARHQPQLEWASDLARAIQMSLFVFCIAGAALSMAYYDGLVICLGLLVCLGEIARSPPSEGRSPITTAPSLVGPLQH